LEANGDAHTQNEGVGKHGETSAPSTPPQPGTNEAGGKNGQLNVELKTCTGIGRDKICGSLENIQSKQKSVDSQNGQVIVEEKAFTGIGSDKLPASIGNIQSKKRSADSMDQAESLKRQKTTSTDKVLFSFTVYFSLICIIHIMIHCVYTHTHCVLVCH
jgi:hypothetical protein